MSPNANHLSIAPRIKVPSHLQEFSETSMYVLLNATQGTLDHTGSLQKRTHGPWVLEHCPPRGPDGETPYYDFDRIAIELGGNALSVTMEHRHAQVGQDHEMTVGPERETVVFQNIPVYEPPDEHGSHDQDENHIIGYRDVARSYRSNSSRVFAVEDITDNVERGEQLTKRLLHVLAAVGVTLHKEETPRLSEVSQESTTSNVA